MPEPSTPASPAPDSEALADAYRFFNEIGIIAQLSSNQMQRSLPHALNQSQFSVLNWFVRVDDEATPGRLAAGSASIAFCGVPLSIRSLSCHSRRPIRSAA